MLKIIFILNLMWGGMTMVFASTPSVEIGKASWYSINCNGGTQTASGIKLSNNALTAAHKTLPMGTKVKVTNLSNNKSVICTITDVGPFIRGRIIDVTVGVADKLGFKKRGITKVKVEVVEKGSKFDLIRNSIK